MIADLKEDVQRPRRGAIAIATVQGRPSTVRAMAPATLPAIASSIPSPARFRIAQ